MRLYVTHCDRRIYLGISASDRYQLAESVGTRFRVQCPRCGGYYDYSVDEVVAEPESGAAPGGAILGGLIGLIGGPLGMLIGGGVGTLWGAKADQDEERKANRFNRS